MIGLVALLGLVLGSLLNQLIAFQLRNDVPVVATPGGPLSRLPIVGALAGRAWLPLAVEVITTLMTVALWLHYGWSLRFVLLLAATLVLIDTAAIDWKVKLIDTLVLIGATIVVVAVAPLIGNSWRGSFLGLFGAGFVFLLFFIIAKILYPSQQAPFGLGDVYLGMFIGALMGFKVGEALFYGIVMAGFVSVAMIVVLGYQRARYIPISYGTFLCLGVLLHLVLFRFT